MPFTETVHQMSTFFTVSVAGVAPLHAVVLPPVPVPVPVVVALVVPLWVALVVPLPPVAVALVVVDEPPPLELPHAARSAAATPESTVQVTLFMG
jgi:hypothetical protein